MASNLATMSPAQLSQIPAGTPPPGVQPNFVDPPSDGYVLITVGSIFMAIMFKLEILHQALDSMQKNS
jgi:hypothetical protein